MGYRKARFHRADPPASVKLRRMLAELPSASRADEVLSSMAGPSRARSRPSRLWRRPRSATLILWILKAALIVGVPVYVAHVFIPAVLNNMAASIIHAFRPAAASRPVPGVTRLSKKEAEEWDRKNAESMRILEKTTPSVP